jgi:hypothetical protein
MIVVFWLSVAFVFYTYVLYPLLITVWGSVFPKRVAKKYHHKPLSVVLAVRDEERHVQTRL